MNLIAVTTFLHKTCRDIFNYVLKARFSDGCFFSSVLAYFGTIKINGQGILYLHYLEWLKEISNFFDLHRRIVDEDRFKTQILSFLD